LVSKYYQNEERSETKTTEKEKTNDTKVIKDQTYLKGGFEKIQRDERRGTSKIFTSLKKHN
jgi:hypothetical protein